MALSESLLRCDGPTEHPINESDRVSIQSSRPTVSAVDFDRRLSGPSQRRLGVYSVEKHQIGGDVIFLPPALASLDPLAACA